MRNILYFYKKDESGKNIPFPNDKEPLQVCEYEYKADKMGGKPTITATVKHTLCLDNLWDGVFTIYNEEEYYVKNVPTSSKDNTDQRYVHNVTFSSARDILETVYFIDAVQGDSTEDVYKSNSTKVLFMGDIKEYVGRLNACMQYVGLPYTVVIDEGITSEAKLVSFEDKYLSEALQEIYNIYGLSYYFDGQTIHIGEYQYEILEPFQYGIENGLLSIKKENANYKTYNRCTGIGSSDNIPFYYPNATEKGNIGIQYYDWSGIVEDSKGEVVVSDMDLFLKNASLNDIYRFHMATIENIVVEAYRDGNKVEYEPNGIAVDDYYITDMIDFKVKFTLNGSGYVTIIFNSIGIDIPFNPYIQVLEDSWTVSDNVELINSDTEFSLNSDNVIQLKLHIINKGSSEVELNFSTGVWTGTGLSGAWKPKIQVIPQKNGEWVLERTNEVVDLSDIGINVVYDCFDGFGFSQIKESWITPMPNLMPSIYRKSNGKEQFYNAENNKYLIPDSDEYYEFENLFSDSTRSEGKLVDEGIKPTIKNVVNAEGLNIDMISAIAFDATDSDETKEDSDGLKYIHPYFFVKLKKFDGEMGFNLFDHAIDGQAMTIEFTDGQCGACKFEIGVSDEDNKTNIVQVNDDGTLKRDNAGNIIRSGAGQARQNDTSQYEVWIALKKEESTYGQIMPNATQSLRPSVNDHFVITGINLPQAYITAAEKKLDEAIIEYMAQNNTEKFTFSIVFSRIFLQKNPDILDKLNENSKIYVKYNDLTYPLFVDSYSYKMNEGEALPEITVSLTDTLALGSNSMANIVSEVKKQIFSAPEFTQTQADFDARYLKKIYDDIAYGRITFMKGLSLGLDYFLNSDGYAELRQLIIKDLIKSKDFVSGVFGSGFGLMAKDANGLSYLEIDKLLVRIKAIFTELEIRKITYSGGNFVFSPAGMTCTAVIEYSDRYRCFFTAKDGDDTVENLFAVDDLVMSRSFNIKEGEHQNVSNSYYWRRCVGVGADYIELSKEDRDMASNDTPKTGDALVTFGNKTDADRQNVIVLSVIGEGSPSIVQYQGINDYVLTNKDKTVISPNGNKFTGSFLFSSGGSVEDELKDIYDRLDNIGGVDTIYRIDLTNEISGVAADFDGTVTGELPYTDINVFAGNKADSGWVFSAEYKGCEGNIEGSRLTITALTEDTATATITATKEGVSTTLTAVMNIYKVRAGSGPAPVVKVTANSQVIKITTGDDGSVTCFPESIKFTAKLTNTEGVTWYLYDSINNEWSEVATEEVFEISSKDMALFIDVLGGSLTFRCQSGEVYDDITIYNVQDGADGTDGTDGENAYTVILDNESHTFAGNTTSALVGSTICGITAYVGATQKAVTIGSLTNVPIGMSYQINNNGTTSANILFMVDETMTTKNGVVDIPVTVEGETFTKGFSYALSLQGEDGEPAVVYSIIPSVNQIVKSFDGTIKPTTVSCTKYKTVGSETTVTTEKALKYKREGVDSTEQNYTGPVTVTSNTTSIVFTLYDGSTMLDKETVPVLVDADGVLEESKIYADSVIEATEDRILLNTYKWIQGGRNLITNTYKPYTVVGNGKTNQTFTNWDILPECKGKSIVTAFKINFTGCTFQSGSRVIFQAYDTYGWNYQIFSSKNISANGDYEVVGIITAPSNLTGLAPVYIRLDYITGGKVTISDMRAYLSDSTEPLLPWEPCPNDLVSFDSRIELNKDSISLKVQELVTGRGSNILYNSSFSIDTKGWSGYNDSKIDYKFGSPCLVMTQLTNIAKFLTQKVGNRILDKSEGAKYTISFDICKPSTLTTLNVMLYAGGTINPEDEAEAIDLREIPNYTWTRVSKTQTIKSSSDCEYLVFGNRTGGTSQGTYYIKNVQLEYGDTATPWKESYGGLLATGIDIQNGKIALTANKTVIQANDGTEIAMFTLDNSGKPVIKAENIDVNNLKVKYLETSAERYDIRNDKIVIDAESNTFKMLIKDTLGERNVFDLMFTEDSDYGTIADMLFNRYDGSTLTGRTQINQNFFLIESYLRNKVSHASKITSEYILLQNNNVDDSSGTVQDSIKLSASTGLTITDRNTAKSYNGKTQSIYVTTSDGPFFMNFYRGFFVGMSPSAWFSTSN